jgi:hypothetical protein
MVALGAGGREAAMHRKVVEASGAIWPGVEPSGAHVSGMTTRSVSDCTATGPLFHRVIPKRRRVGDFKRTD